MNSFQVVNVQGNSVRVRTGLVTFIVHVLQENGKLRIRKSNDVYVHGKDFPALIHKVLTAYEDSVAQEYSVDATQANRDLNHKG
jgi:hypothetical protein